jgi:hypothetical protein
MTEMNSGPLSPSGMTMLPGSVLAHTYEIRRLINSGGMGRVYEALNKVTGDTVAVKVIRPELLGDERLRAMFVREAAVLRRIRDEAIVGYEGMFQDEQGRGFLVMNYIHGPSLAEQTSRQKLTEAEALDLMRRLASGLETAHAAGICHRDISPDNVLLPEGDLARATLIDFGIAKLVDPEAGTLVGTDIAGKAGYMSPEQLGVFNAEIGPRSDIYSLALVIAAAVRGAPVDMGTSFADIVEARRRVPPLDGVPIGLRDRLRAMLAPEPGDRPASMTALLEDLQQGGSSPAVANTSNARVGNGGIAGPSTRPQPRRGRWALVAAAAAIVVAGAGVAYLFLAPPPAPELAVAPAEPPAEAPPDTAPATLPVMQSALPPDVPTATVTQSGSDPLDGVPDAVLSVRVDGLLETRTVASAPLVELPELVHPTSRPEPSPPSGPLANDEAAATVPVEVPQRTPEPEDLAPVPTPSIAEQQFVVRPAPRPAPTPAEPNRAPPPVAIVEATRPPVAIVEAARPPVPIVEAPPPTLPTEPLEVALPNPLQSVLPRGRSRGDKPLAMLSATSESERCATRSLPYFRLVGSEVSPNEVSPGDRLSHRLVYALCPAPGAGEQRTGVTRKIVRHDNLVVVEETASLAIRPGTWANDDDLMLPRMVTPGRYGVETTLSWGDATWTTRADFVID